MSFHLFQLVDLSSFILDNTNVILYTGLIVFLAFLFS